MAVTVTTQTVDGATVIVAEQVGGSGVAIAINYSTLYDRMADALESIEANVASIKTTLNNIAGNTATIATEIATIDTSLSNINANLSTIRVNSTTMATLASGNGIHMVGPYDSYGAVSLYRLYVEEGEILKTGNYVSDEKEEEANAAIATMINKVEPFREF
jgi:hypothetical protein